MHGNYIEESTGLSNVRKMSVNDTLTKASSKVKRASH